MHLVDAFTQIFVLKKKKTYHTFQLKMYGPVIPLYIWKKNSEIILIGAFIWGTENL